jgi:Flp pilus assembly protein TadD
VITGYEAPQAEDAGSIAFRITVAATDTEVSREVTVIEALKVEGRRAVAAEKVLGPAARAVARAITEVAIPALSETTPADRELAAQRARRRGQEAAASGVPGPAVQDLRRAAQLTPEDAATHVALGEALVKQGRLASALLEFRQALALEEAGGSAADTGLRLRVVRALSQRGLWDEAGAEARRGLEKNPESEELRLLAAEAAVQAGNGPGALEALQALHARRAPRDGEWRMLAEAHALAGDAARWLDATVRGAVAGVPEDGQYAAVVRRLDQLFRLLADEAEAAERRILAGQQSLTAFRGIAERRAAQARLAAEYLSRLAYPDSMRESHLGREQAWSGLARAGEHALRFGAGGTFNDLAAARGERLRAVAQFDQHTGGR